MSARLHPFVWVSDLDACLCPLGATRLADLHNGQPYLMAGDPRLELRQVHCSGVAAVWKILPGPEQFDAGADVLRAHAVFSLEGVTILLTCL